MVKHTQTIRRQIVWLLFGVALKELKTGNFKTNNQTILGQISHPAIT